MQDTSTKEQPIFAAVLAAGQAKRFGSAKLLADYAGEPLVAHAARLAASICGQNALLVTGHCAAEVAAAAAAHHRGAVIVNRHFAVGIGTSISLATRTLADRAAAILLLLADQPLITEAHLRNMVTAWSGSATEIVASAYAGTVGPPILLPRGLFAELETLNADQGAQSLLNKPHFTTRRIAFEPAAVDIDTRRDLERLNQPLD